MEATGGSTLCPCFWTLVGGSVYIIPSLCHIKYARIHYIHVDTHLKRSTHTKRLNVIAKKTIMLITMGTVIVAVESGTCGVNFTVEMNIIVKHRNNTNL